MIEISFNFAVCKNNKILLILQKLSKIMVVNAVEGYNKAFWPEYIQWHFEHVQKFERVFKPYMKDAYQVIK